MKNLAHSASLHSNVKSAPSNPGIKHPADQTIELLEYQRPDRPSAPAKPFDPGFAHLALMVDDLDALLVRIAAYGWTAQGIPQPIASNARAGTRVIQAVGPDGATIEFRQPAASVQDL